ncbi:MAG: hypothetical protein J7L08_00645 [Candidatus Aenigmarchaeota archaeon]|nr:hypothetical protein [Candidatus Aenigmarchaeota archaeon]
MLNKFKETGERYKLLKELTEVAKVESALLKGARKFFEKNKYTEVVVPHLTRATGSCENMNTLFEVDYFGKRAFLSQTGQLYLESLIPELKKVWCIGPSFRAEPKADSRHLTEFPLIELEFNGNFNELLDGIEKLIMSMIKEILHDNGIKIVDKKRLSKINAPFKRITYSEAIEELKEFGMKWGDDLKNIHEKYLVKKFGNQPLFITHFPIEMKFFNMKRNESNPNIVNSADLILPMGGEAVGAAEREFKYEDVMKRLKKSQMFRQLLKLGGGIEDFKWYLNFLKEMGNVPHAGCGIGLNRVTQFILGMDDIRASTVYPLNSETLM